MALTAINVTSDSAKHFKQAGRDFVQRLRMQSDQRAAENQTTKALMTVP